MTGDWVGVADYVDEDLGGCRGVIANAAETGEVGEFDVGVRFVWWHEAQRGAATG